MIESFKSKMEEALFDGLSTKSFAPNLVKVTRRKSHMLHAAERLEDLRCPPGNRLEALSVDRKGLHTIRINDQFHICFRWTNAKVHDVEIVDYH